MENTKSLIEKQNRNRRRSIAERMQPLRMSTPNNSTLKFWFNDQSKTSNQSSFRNNMAFYKTAIQNEADFEYSEYAELV